MCRTAKSLHCTLETNLTVYLLYFNINFKKKILGGLFVYFDTESARTCVHKLRRAERQSERVPSRLHAVGTEPDAGLDLTNGEIMT